MDKASVIDLSANENPLGASPRALDAIQRSLSGLHRYPEKDGDPLRDALAQQLKLQRNQLLLGNGATELLEFAARACLSLSLSLSLSVSQTEGQASEALIATPCFIPYQNVIRRAGGQLIGVPCVLGDDPLPALLAAVTARTRLIILGTPNNPCGSIIPHQRLETFIRALPPQVLVVVDEAYIEYVSHPDCADSLALLAQGHNLLILRSLSKAYALAGLRLGYAIGNPSMIERLNGQRQHYNTNSLAQAAALAALSDRQHLAATLANNCQGRAYLARSFSALGLNYLPSQANFYLVEVGDGERYITELALRGIKVKSMARYQLPRHIRVSIGLPQQNLALVLALQQLLRPVSQPLEKPIKQQVSA